MGGGATPRPIAPSLYKDKAMHSNDQNVDDARGHEEDSFDNVVFDYLNECSQGSSEPIIARALGLSEHEVGEVLDRLTEAGRVRIVRRTRSSTTFGVTKGE